MNYADMSQVGGMKLMVERTVFVDLQDSVADNACKLLDFISNHDCDMFFICMSKNGREVDSCMITYNNREDCMNENNPSTPMFSVSGDNMPFFKFTDEMSADDVMEYIKNNTMSGIRLYNNLTLTDWREKLGMGVCASIA